MAQESCTDLIQCLLGWLLLTSLNSTQCCLCVLIYACVVDIADYITNSVLKPPSCDIFVANQKLAPSFEKLIILSSKKQHMKWNCFVSCWVETLNWLTKMAQYFYSCPIMEMNIFEMNGFLIQSLYLLANILNSYYILLSHIPDHLFLQSVSSDLYITGNLSKWDVQLN